MPSFILMVLTVAALPCNPVTAADSPSPTLSQLTSKIQSELNPDEAMVLMRRVYSTDRWFNFPKFMETAEYLEGEMQQIGLQNVQVGKPPADGVTQAGFWTMPLAWDAKQATLEIVDPRVPAELRVLCNYQKVPTSLGEWSAPTLPGGITAEVIEVKDWPASKIAKMDLRGKLAMTDENPAGIKWALVKAGALGAINAFSENPSLLDARQWMNAWGDYGWAFIKSSAPLLYFSVTPRQAEMIRRLIAQHGSVRVRAEVDTRYYTGVYPYTTGVIAGTGPEEVLALGHTSEEGAGDNASGVAALMEAMATLNRLISKGDIPKPRRSIRILAMPEMFGSMYYIKMHAQRMHRTIAAICLDTPAEKYDLAGAIYTFYLNPGVGSSYTDSFILKVADEYFSRFGRAWHWHRFGTGTDSFLGDRTIGVPTVWAYSGNDVHTPHHSSADTPDKVDVKSLRDLSTVTAAYLYYLANAGEPQALWLAGVAQDWGYQQILRSARPFANEISRADSSEELGRDLALGREKIAYSAGRQMQAVRSVLQLTSGTHQAQLRRAIAPLAADLTKFGQEQSARLQNLADARAELLGISQPVEARIPLPTENDAASAIVVKRRRFGTIPLDHISPEQREGYPSGAWDLVPITALYWCDGHRNLAEVIHLTQMELGPTKFDFVGYFRFLRDHGFVTFVKGQ